MSSPFTLEKSWLFSCNNYNASSGNISTDAHNVAYTIISQIIALGVWTVRMSSNGTSYGNTNYINSAADIVHKSTGTAHSWIVFRLPNGSDILWDFNDTTAYYSSIRWSAGGLFTGGSLTAAPTATDDLTLYNDATWINLSSSSQATETNVIMSSDGLHCRAFVYASGVRILSWLIETLADVTTASPTWTPPMVIRLSIASDATSFGSLATSNAFKFRWNSANYTGGATTEWSPSSGTPIAQANSGIANDWTGGFGGSQMGFASYTTNCRGRLGRFVDLWVGSNAVTDGDTYPSTGTLYQFAQFEHLIVPWNSTAPVSKT